MDTQTAHEAALTAAQEASKWCLENTFKGRDAGPCGFAWVETYSDGRSRNAKLLKSLGFQKGWKPRHLILWNPGQIGVQSIDILVQGAWGYVHAMRPHLPEGIKLSVSARLD